MLPAIWTERIKCYFELFPYVFINEDVMGFPIFQADDATKVQPTKIHVVSHIYMIHDFVSDGLYRMVQSG